MKSLKRIEKPPAEEFSVSGLSYLPMLRECTDLLQHLNKSFARLKSAINKTSEQQLMFRYAPDKWTVKETLVHLVDDERIYSYRALCFARNEKTPLPGFNQDDYSMYSEANNRMISSIMEEYEAVRCSTISLFNGLPDEALFRKGSADNGIVSVRALGYHIAAHEAHHFNPLT